MFQYPRFNINKSPREFRDFRDYPDRYGYDFSRKIRSDYYEHDYGKSENRREYPENIPRLQNNQTNPPPGFQLNPAKRETENWDNLFLNEDQGRKRREEVNNRVRLTISIRHKLR